MRRINKFLVGALALGALAGTAGSAYAFDKPTLTDDQKAAMEKARTLFQAGNTEEAQTVLTDAGIKFGPMMRKMHSKEDRQKIDEALSSGDYATFQELTADAPFSDKLTPEIFSKLQEAYKLRQSGDMEGAQAIMDELGIKPPHDGDFERPNLTDDQKAALEKAKELFESGDQAGAKQVLDDAGIQPPHMGMHMRGQFSDQQQ